MARNTTDVMPRFFVVYVPVGLGSFTSGDNRLDSQLAGAVMGIQMAARDVPSFLIGIVYEPKRAQ